VYLDSNLYDKVVGYNRGLLFSANEKGLVKFCGSHVTEDELAAIPEKKAQKRRALVALLEQLPEMVLSTPAVFDFSRLDRSTFGDERSVAIYDQLKDRYGPRDAIHVATAQAAGCDYFVTEDAQLRRGVRALALSMKPCSYADLVSLLGILLYEKPPVYRYLTDEELEYLLPMACAHSPDKIVRIRGHFPRVAGARLEHGIAAPDGEQFKLTLEAAKSDMLRGVHLATDLFLVLNGSRRGRQVALFFGEEEPVEYEARWKGDGGDSVFGGKGTEYIVECHSKEGMLWLWNVCAYYSQGVRLIRGKEMFCGMLVEEVPNGYRYRCNDIQSDDDYDDVIFRIERIGNRGPHTHSSRTPTR